MMCGMAMVDQNIEISYNFWRLFCLIRTFRVFLSLGKSWRSRHDNYLQITAVSLFLENHRGWRKPFQFFSLVAPRIFDWSSQLGHFFQPSSSDFGLRLWSVWSNGGCLSIWLSTAMIQPAKSPCNAECRSWRWKPGILRSRKYQASDRKVKCCETDWNGRQPNTTQARLGKIWHGDDLDLGYSSWTWNRDRHGKPWFVLKCKARLSRRKSHNNLQMWRKCSQLQATSTSVISMSFAWMIMFTQKEVRDPVR